MSALATAIELAQGLLDPFGQGIFTFERLEPYLQIAYDRLRDDGMASRELALVSAQVMLTLPAGSTNLQDHVGLGGGLENMARPICIRQRAADRGKDAEWRYVIAGYSVGPSEWVPGYDWWGGDVRFRAADRELQFDVLHEQLWLAQLPRALPARGLAEVLGYWTAGLMATAMREQQLGAGYVAEARHLLFRWAERQKIEAERPVRQEAGA
ncbi:MAG: hypothetical protein ACRD1M_06815 [Terriglobales bacterium]